MRQLHTFFRTTALSALLALAACGGSNDGATTADPPPPPPPALTAPVISAEPQDISVAEGQMGSFSVVASSNAGDIGHQWRLGDPAVAIDGATAAAFTTAALALTDDGKRYSVALSNTAGTTTSRVAVLSVTERQWSAAAPIVSGAEPGVEAYASGETPLAIDDAGHTHAVFVQRDTTDAGLRMWSAYRAAGAAEFSRFTRLTPADELPSPYSPQYTRLVVAPSGHVLAAWLHSYTGSNPRVYVSVFTPDAGGGSWSPAGNAIGDTVTHWDRFDAAPAGDGAFEIAWRARLDENDTRTRVFTRRLNVATDGMSFDAIVQQSPADADAYAPKLAGDGHGRVMLAFVGYAGDMAQVFGASRSGQTGWSEPAEVDGVDNADVDATNLVMNRHGQGVLVMQAPQARVHARRFAFSGAAPEWLDAAAPYVANHTDGGGYGTSTSVDDAGRIHIVSVHGNGRRLSRWMHDGQGWGALQSIADLSASSEALPVLLYPALASDGAGNLMVAWNELSGSDGWRVMARRHHVGLDQWRDTSLPLASAHSGLATPGLVMRSDGTGSLLGLVSQGEQHVRGAEFR